MESQHPTFAEPTLSVARRNLRRLFDVLGAATGWPPTFVGFVARGEPKWARQFEERDFTHSGYDVTVARLSAIWPDGVEWPAEVPRQAPATDVPQEILDKIAARGAPKAPPAPRDCPALPGGAAWPEDIPKPETTKTPTAAAVGGANGKDPQAR